MKCIIAAIILLATAEIAAAEDCNAPQSGFATFTEWIKYKEACEQTCEKMPTIFCERHSHGDHEHAEEDLFKHYEEANERKRIRQSNVRSPRCSSSHNLGRVA